MSLMHVRPGEFAQSNSPIRPAAPSAPDQHFLFLSIFDGHGGSDTADYCFRHFHEFLRIRVEARMHQWKEQMARNAASNHAAPAAFASELPPSAGQPPQRIRGVKRRHSVTDSPLVASSAASTRTNSGSASAAAHLPPHPIDSDFLTRVFLEFDASIPGAQSQSQAQGPQSPR